MHIYASLYQRDTYQISSIDSRRMALATADRTQRQETRPNRNCDSGLPVRASVVKMNIYKSNCLPYYRRVIAYAVEC